MTGMDKNALCRILPERPSAKFENWMRLRMAEEFIQDMMIFSAERFSYEDGDGKKRSTWVSRCICTACTSDFETAHVAQGAMKGFAMYQGEDGYMYPIDPLDKLTPMTSDELEDYGIESGYVEVTENDQIMCPWCGEVVSVIHKSRLRGGKTRQLLGCSVENVAGYTAVVCWLAARRWYDDGSYDVEIYPRDAYVVGDRGGITRYRHTQGGGAFSVETRTKKWEIATSMRDSFTVPYHDWGSNCNRKVGGCVWRECGSMEGQTGEKSGLAAYIQDGGAYPITYLKLWKKNKTVENLVNNGWTRLIEESISRYTNFDARVLYTEVTGVDFSKAKPHEMLKMSKEDFKKITKRPGKWSAELFNKWARYHDTGGGCSALEFEKFYKQANGTGVEALLTLRKEDDQIDIPKVARYMEKQGLPLSDLHYLVDARRMAEEVHPDQKLTKEELWPRRLMAAHNRLQEIQRVQQDEKKSRDLQAGFDEIRKAYGCLEWTDGDLQILLPKGNQDLIHEGAVLQHCVGGYGQGHVEGRGVIFFVRKYRRPERSFFTLDINMKGSTPNEVQLHGYKNEHISIGKRRKIPARVRNFVDRWKSEILLPWYLQEMNKKEKTA